MENQADSPSTPEPTKTLETIAVGQIYEHMLNLGVGRRYLDSELDKCRVMDQLDSYLKNGRKNILDGQGLFIGGPVGTGKTRALVIVMRNLIRNYTRPVFLIDSEGNRFQHDGSWDYLKCVWTSADKIFEAVVQKKDEFINRVCNTTCLFIDDFGTGYQHEYPFSGFYQIIEHRYANMLPVYVSSNATKEDLNNPKFQRIVDRWRECCYVIQIGGKSMRGEKKSDG